MKDQYYYAIKCIFLMMLMLPTLYATSIKATMSEEEPNSSTTQPAVASPQGRKEDSSPEREAKLQKLDAIRAAQIEAVKRTKYEESRLATLQKLEQYLAAIKVVFNENWKVVDKKRPFKCEIEFTQVPGGLVLSVEFLDCPNNKAERSAIEKALMIEPMPYSGFESVFKRKMQMVACSPEQFCDLPRICLPGSPGTKNLSAVTKVSPIYPRKVKKKGITGTSVIDVKIDAKGNVLSFIVHETSGDVRLDRAALDAIRQWSFSPAACNDGTPVGGVLRIPIAFSIP